MLQWLHSQGCPWNEGTLWYAAAQRGNVEMLQWLRRNGNEAMLQWFSENSVKNLIGEGGDDDGEEE